VTERVSERRGFFAPPLPRVIAHRGLATTAVENTLEAFRAALDAGATHLETDVQATLDGEAVILHDHDLRRVLGDTAEQALVASLTLPQLRELVAARFEICTLTEALQTFPSALFNIDVKVGGAVLPAARAIRDSSSNDRVLVTSFSTRRRRAAVRAIGAVATSASASTMVPVVVACRLGWIAVARRLLKGIDAVQIPERIVGIGTTTPAMIRRLHAAGVEVHVWTINEPGDMRRLLAAGADGIVTDRCDVLATLVGSSSSAH